MKRKQKVGKVEKFNDIERKKREQEEGNAFDIIGIKWQVKFPIYEIKKYSRLFLGTARGENS